MMANLLELIRTDGNTLCQCSGWSTDRFLCNDDAVRSGGPQIVRALG